MTAVHRAVFVDLDGTLIDRPGSEARFLRYLFLRGRLGSRQIMAAAAFFLVHGIPLGRHAARKNKAYLYGLDTGETSALAGAWVRRELIPGLRPLVLERLESHRQAGDRIVLLTGAPDFIAEPLAAYLELDDCIATQPAKSDGRFAFGPPDRHPFGAAKLHLAQAWCERTKLALSHSVAYADAHYDIPLLRAVEHAVAVTPDVLLAPEALRLGWEILEPNRVAGAWAAPNRLSIPE